MREEDVVVFGQVGREGGREERKMVAPTFMPMCLRHFSHFLTLSLYLSLLFSTPPSLPSSLPPSLQDVSLCIPKWGNHADAEGEGGRAGRREGGREGGSYVEYEVVVSTCTEIWGVARRYRDFLGLDQQLKR